jgi:integrase
MAKSDIWFREETGQWYLNVWDPIRRVKIKKALGPNKRRAEKVATQVRARLVNSELGIKTPGKSPTIEEFKPRFVKGRYAGRPQNTQRLVERTLCQFRQFAGDIRIAAIDKGLLKRYVDKRLGDRIGRPFHGTSDRLKESGKQKSARLVSKLTVNQEVSVLLCMMNRAVEWGVLDVNPLAGFKKFPTKDRRRKRYLHQSEIAALLRAAEALKSPAFLDIVMLALYTGRRRGEILSLRKRDYDRVNGYLLLEKTKRGEADQIPVPPTVQAVLDRRSAEVPGEWFFPNDKGTGPLRDIRTAFLRAIKAAGITDCRFHDLRHTSISYQIMSGVDPYTIAALAGHTTQKMIDEVYGHLSPKHKQASSMLFGSYMDRLTGKGAAQGPEKAAPSGAPIVQQVSEIINGEASQPADPPPTQAPAVVGRFSTN